MKGSAALLRSPSVADSCLFPDGIVRTLETALQGARILNVHVGGGATSAELRALFRPSRLVDCETEPDSSPVVSISQPRGAFDGVFLLGLLPVLVDPRNNLFAEATRALKVGGTLVASTPHRARKDSPIPRWALEKARGPLDLTFELTRGELELVKAHVGVMGAGRFLIVARKRAPAA